MDADSSHPDRACPTCGSPVADADTFCHTCGATLPELERPSPAEPLPTVVPVAPAPELRAAAPRTHSPSARDVDGDRHPRRRRVVAALVALLALAGVGALIVVANDDEPAEPSTLPAETVADVTGDSAAATTATIPAASTAPTTATPTTATPTTTTPTTTTTTTIAPTTTGTTPVETTAWVPGFFATPDEAIADWLSQLPLAYAGTCESLAGREVELGGTVLCSQYVETLAPAAQIHIWGVFATDDFGGWLLVDVGSAGWSIADESLEYERPDW